jgi:hypothetical protein
VLQARRTVFWVQLYWRKTILEAVSVLVGGFRAQVQTQCKIIEEFSGVVGVGHGRQDLTKLAIQAKGGTAAGRWLVETCSFGCLLTWC